MTTEKQSDTKLSTLPVCFRRVRPIRIAVAIAFLVAGTCVVSADEFQLSLNGGSVITVEVASSSFVWTNVQFDGELLKKRIPFAKLQQLVLSESPASEQVADIRRLINLLESDDYLQRQMAEARLSDPKIASNFTTLIKSKVNHPSYEVRYRIERILDELDTDDGDVSASEFDRLILKDGSAFEGDAGTFRLECTYRGRKMTFSRSDVRLMSVPLKSNLAVTAGAPVKVKMFHQHQGHFYLPHQTTVDFEQAPNGADIGKATIVNEMFTNVGLKLDTEQQGYVGISGYGFKFPGKPASGNSICVFETVGSFSKRFKGVMEMSFCMPNQKSVAAGVNEIGFLMGRVNNSRDFIVEAYNADGQILASVESSDQACVFSGVKSNEPIAKIRILSNPYLFRIDRAIDVDFAVDSVCFSKPVAISASAMASPTTVMLRNGDLIKAESISILGNGSVSFVVPGFDSMVVGQDEIASLQLAAKPARSKKVKSWTAMLPDRSMLFVKPGKTFTSTTFGFLSFKPDDLMGIGSSQNPARFPEATDFDRAKSVLVFPTCRIAANDLTFSELGFTWEESARKIEQPLFIDNDERNNEDPTPTFSAVQYSKAWPENIPTVWMRSPTSHENDSGRLRLADGQQLVLSNDAQGFQLTGLDKNEVTVSVAGQQTKIPIKNVLSIDFPNPEPSR